jgi:hypothetical protein
VDAPVGNPAASATEGSIKSKRPLRDFHGADGDDGYGGYVDDVFDTNDFAGGGNGAGTLCKGAEDPPDCAALATFCSSLSQEQQNGCPVACDTCGNGDGGKQDKEITTQPPITVQQPLEVGSTTTRPFITLPPKLPFCLGGSTAKNTGGAGAGIAVGAIVLVVILAAFGYWYGVCH